MKISALGVEEQRVNVVLDFVEPSPAARASLGDGYRVEVRVVIWESPNVVKVPTSALFRHGEQWAVYVIDRRPGAADPRRVGTPDGSVRGSDLGARRRRSRDSPSRRHARRRRSRARTTPGGQRPVHGIEDRPRCGQAECLRLASRCSTSALAMAPRSRSGPRSTRRTTGHPVRARLRARPVVPEEARERDDGSTRGPRFSAAPGLLRPCAGNPPSAPRRSGADARTTAR